MWKNTKAKPLRTINYKKHRSNRIDELMELNPEVGTQQSDELKNLVLLVEKYEEINWNISTPDPIEAIKYRMEEMN